MKKILLLLIIIFSSDLVANEKSEFLSLKKSKVNVRYGPGFDYPVKFIYKKINLPVKIIDKKENFRRIIDFKKNSGWIHRTLLKKSNSIIILEDKILFKKASNFSKPILKLKKGKMLILKKCKAHWCKIKTEKYIGWVKANDVWGSIN